MKNDNPHNFKIVVLKTIGEIINYKEILNDKLLNQKSFFPTADIDFYINRISCKENILNPYCILLFQEDLIKVILFGYIEKKTNAIQIGNKKLIGISVNCLHIVAGGFFIELTTCEIIFFYEYLLSKMKDDFDAIQIDSFSMNYALLKLYKRNFFKNIIIDRNTQCQANVSDSYDVFCKNRSKNTRKGLRKREKQLYKHYDQKDICVKIFNNINDLATTLNDIEIIASKTYQRKISVGFLNDKETQILYKKMLSENKLYALILYIENIPRAFHTGLVFNNIFYGLTKGYDPDFANLNIGHFLFIYMIKYLCSVENIKYYDFGIGDSYYKNQVSDRKLTIFQAKIFPNSTMGYISFSITKTNKFVKKAVTFIKKLL